MTRTKMRKELLLGTVALMAGIGLASAQGLREGGSAGGSERGDVFGVFTDVAGFRHRAAWQRNAWRRRSRSQSKQPKRSPDEPRTRSGRGVEESDERPGQRSTGKVDDRPGLCRKERVHERFCEQGREQQARTRTRPRAKHEGMTNSRSSTQDSKKNEKSTTGQASSDKNERSTAGQGPRDRNEGSKAESQEKSPSSQPAQKQTPDAGKRKAEPNDEFRDARSAKYAAIRRFGSIAGRHHDNRAAADDDPTVGTVGPERAARE